MGRLHTETASSVMNTKDTNGVDRELSETFLRRMLIFGEPEVFRVSILTPNVNGECRLWC